MNLVEKYRAKKYEDFVGQAEAIQIIEEFIKTFPKKKALLIHGPPGTGKTALVFAAAKSHNLEILELNASDLRNREALEIRLRPATSQQSLFKK